MKNTCGCLWLVLAFSLPLAALGGERTNIMGLGMGRTAVASSGGLDAIGINPANLAGPGNPAVTISLLPVGLNAGTDFMTYDLYTDYFTGVATDSGRVGRYLTGADKQRILGAFGGGLGNGTLEFETRGFGLALDVGAAGAFAFTLTDRVAAFGRIPQEYLQFLFYGNPPGSVYDFGETSVKAAWTREFTLTYARKLPALPFVQSSTAGISAKFVQGFSYFAIERFNSRLATSPEGVLDGTVDFWSRKAGLDPTVDEMTPFPAPAGKGFGFDLGVAAAVTDYFRAGLSVTDIGSITWTGNLRETVASGLIHMDNPLDGAQRDSVEDALRGVEREGSEFSTSLPTTLRLGGAVALHRIAGLRSLIYGELLVAADYTQGLVDLPGTTTTGRFSFGLQYAPWKFLPIRAGASFWGAEGSSFSFGVGLHFGVFELDLATETLEWVFSPGSFSRGSAAMGMKLRIG
jgi:hypothetical protein